MTRAAIPAQALRTQRGDGLVDAMARPGAPPLKLTPNKLTESVPFLAVRAQEPPCLPSISRGRAGRTAATPRHATRVLRRPGQDARRVRPRFVRADHSRADGSHVPQSQAAGGSLVIPLRATVRPRSPSRAPATAVGAPAVPGQTRAPTDDPHRTAQVEVPGVVNWANDRWGGRSNPTY